MKKKLEVYQLNNVAKVFVGNLVWEYYEIIHNLQTLKIKRLKIEMNYKTLVYFFWQKWELHLNWFHKVWMRFIFWHYINLQGKVLLPPGVQVNCS